MCGRFFLSGRWTAAFGESHQVVGVTGGTTIALPGGPPIQMPTGPLTLPTNIGDHTRNTFAEVPEVSLNLGYRLTAGYEARPGTGVLPGRFGGKIAGQVVVAGYSFWGRGICQMLAEARVPYVAFDIDLERLRVGEASRHNVHYGDVTDPTMMGAVAIATCSAGAGVTRAVRSLPSRR